MMPVYKDPSMVSWKEKGYMDFMLYPRFKELHQSLPQPGDRALLTFFYLTGARPAESLNILRQDVTKDGNIIRIKAKVLKRRGDELINLYDLPTTIPEVQELWDFVRPLPPDFYIFGWLKQHSNVRAYCKWRFGKPVYFFRHNINSLMSLAGASDKQLMVHKGGKSELSVIPYRHLSSKERSKIMDYMVKGINTEEDKL